MRTYLRGKMANWIQINIKYGPLRIKEGAGKRPRPGSIGIGRNYFPAPA
jgi:hypothetical protein